MNGYPRVFRNSIKFCREDLSYLIRGGPDQGKTTLGLHFLAAVESQCASLFISFQESEARLRANAESVGIDVSNINFLNLVPDEHFFTGRQGSDVLPPADVEQESLAESITNTKVCQADERVAAD